MNSELVRFPGADGQQLAARVEQPATGPRAVALFAHCFTCSKDLRSARWISQALVEQGIAVVRFDFTGLGESEGDFADTNFSSNLDDLVAAADFARGRYGAPRILIGHSLGGAAVLAAAARIPDSVAVATIGAPSEARHVKEFLLRTAPELEARGELAGRSFRIKKQLLDDLEGHSLQEAIGRLGRALLIFHSPIDELVGIDHARRIFDAAKHPKSFVSLDRSDHLLLANEAEARYVGDVLAAWASRYLEPSAGPPQAEQGEVVVRGGARGYAQSVFAGPHALRGDEPESVGGTDTGPTPYAFLLASLGT